MSEPISDYALLSDRRALALVSRHGHVDWCCMPRMDSGALFCRLLDEGSGGTFAVTVTDAKTRRRYLDSTLILETEFQVDAGEAVLTDFLAVPEEGRGPTLVRILTCKSGSVDYRVDFDPRFDYGQVQPWTRGGSGVFAAIGGDDGLLVRSEFDLSRTESHGLSSAGTLKAGEKLRITAEFKRPVELDSLEGFDPLDPVETDELCRRTARWWNGMARPTDAPTTDRLGIERSVLTLKALAYEPSGAIVAAASSSLPETRRLTGERNWDYRFSWIRDSALAANSLAELGHYEVADAFRRFIERSAAGRAEELQVLFGIGGERRLSEQVLDNLRGWSGARPVRIGNAAAGQFQLDAFGQILDQSWTWHLRGERIEDDYLDFLVDLVEMAIERRGEPDCGIWEWRSDKRHFVHSKALAWSAIDRGRRLLEAVGREPPENWSEIAREIHAEIESRGYDESEGVFVQAFRLPDMDAALLRLPVTGFVDWSDERMIRTTDAIRERLDVGGLIRRYNADDGMPEEGAFVPCNFWLASCLAHQQRLSEAREVFDRTSACANDLGLFSEEYDPAAKRQLGNFPQALSHLSHVEAVLALEEAEKTAGADHQSRSD